jgi:hypothetical protein
MTKRRSMLVAVAAAVAAATVVGGVVGTGLGDRDPQPPAGGTTDARAGSAHGSAQSRPGTTASSPGSSAGSSSAPDSGSGSDSGSAASTDAAGVERVPETPGTSSPGLPGLSPSASSSPKPDWGDLPTTTTTARGRLADGYPATLLPATPRAAVLTSSVSPSGDRVQVALVARTTQKAGAVLRFYRLHLADAGFAEGDPATAGGAVAASFRRGHNRVVVTVDPGTARTYSVYATLDTSGT